MNILFELLAFIVRRGRINYPLVLMLLFLAGLAFCPFPFYWYWFYERLAIHDWWPWLFPAGGAVLIFSGWLRYKPCGLLGYDRLDVFLSLAALLAGAFLLTTWWAVDWSLERIDGATLAFFLCAAGLAVWWGISSEFWRRIGIVTFWVDLRVVRDIDSGGFRRWLDRVLRRMDAERAVENGHRHCYWGSVHCLQILHNECCTRRHALLRSLATMLGAPGDSGAEAAFDANLSIYENAGSLLADYVRLDWPEPVGDIAAMPQAVTQLAREVVVLNAWRGREDARDVCRTWLARMQSGHPGPLGHDYELLEFLVEMGAEPVDERTSIARACAYLQPFQRQDDRDLLREEGDVWLALSGGFKAPRARLDVWMELHREAGVNPFDDLLRNPADIIHVVAAHELRRIYGQMGTPPAEGAEVFAGRRQYLNEAFDEILETVRSTRASNLRSAPLPEVSEWPHRYVVRTPAVYAGLAAVCVALLVAFLLPVWAVNPRLPWARPWNTVDHVAHAGPPELFNKNPAFTAIAASEDFVVCGTTDGLYAVDKWSRAARHGFGGISILDVTRAHAGNEFLALAETQELALLHPSHGHGGLGESIWLDAPEQPVWPCNNCTDAPVVVANALDSQGWLLAVRGLGVSRYLFKRRPDGRLDRARSFKLGQSSTQPLVDALIARNGVWITLSGGVRRADVQTLDFHQNATLDTGGPPVLTAAYDQDWALAISESGAAWMFEPESGWAGPFFAAPEAGDFQIRNAADVTLVEPCGPTTFLATSRALFYYNHARRSLQLAGEYAATCILPFKNGESGGSDVWGGVLVKAAEGLMKVTLNETGRASLSTLDSQALGNPAADADGSFCLHRAEVLSANPSVSNYAVRVRRRGDGFAVAERVRGTGGWPAGGIEAPPRITGIQPLEDGRLLFTTDNGAFIYNPRTGMYRDASTVLLRGADGAQKKEQRVRFAQFEELERGSTRTLAVAQRNVIYFDDSQSDDHDWVSLDPFLTARARDVTTCGKYVFGLGETSELFTYIADGQSYVRRYGEGTVPALSEDLGPHTMPGDLTVDEAGNWDAVFLSGGVIAGYESAIAKVRQIATMPAARECKLLRATAGGGALVLYNNGTLASPSDLIVPDVFGEGAMPFGPGAITALGQFRTRSDEIVVGSGQGQVMRYLSDRGRWTRVGPGDLPESAGVESLDVSADHVLARTDNGRCYLGDQSSWTGLNYAAAALDGSGDLWVCTTGGNVERRRPAAYQRVDDWQTETFCRADSMKSFMDGAAFAWQPAPLSLVVFSDTAQVGLYAHDKGIWTVERIEAEHPRWVVACAAFAAFQDGQRVCVLNKDRQVTTIASLPAGAEPVGLSLSAEGAIRAAFLLNGAVNVWEWKKPDQPPAKFRRGGRCAEDGIDLSHVFLAKQTSRGALLVDASGGTAVYAPRFGELNVLRPRQNGQQLLAWKDLRIDGERGTLLLFAQGQFAVLVTIRNCELSPPLQIDAPAQSVLTVLERAGFQMQSPQDGLLLESDVLSVERKGGETSYATKPDNLPLTAQACGFAEDIYENAGISGSGSVLTAREGALFQLTPAPPTGSLSVTRYTFKEYVPSSVSTAGAGRIAVEFSNGHSFLATSTASELKFIEPGAQTVLASLPAGDTSLDVGIGTNAGLTMQWRDGSDIPVWEGEKPALLHVRDLALDPSGDIAMLTAAGFAVRDSRSFEISHFSTVAGAASLERVEGPARVLVKDAKNKVRAIWAEQRLAMAEQGASDSLYSTYACGGWNWRIGRDSGAAPSILRPDSNFERQWKHAAGGGFIFADDRPAWICRGPSSVSEFWAATEDGVWRMQASAGRVRRSAGDSCLLRGCNVTRVRLSENDLLCVEQRNGKEQWWRAPVRDVTRPGQIDPPPANSGVITVDAKAVSIACTDSELTFTPFDGKDKPLFCSGKFFFDAGARICPAKLDGDDLLAVLIPHRCVVFRNVERPAAIEACVALPTMPEGAQCSLRADASGRLVVASQNSGEALQQWHLRVSGDALNWQILDETEPEVAAAFWNIRWHLDGAGGISAAPRVNPNGPDAPPSSDVVIPDWWQRDRFAWDAIKDVAALERGCGLLVTPAGVVECDLSRPGDFEFFLHPLPGLTWADIARVEGRRVGAVVGGATGSPEYLLSRAGEGSVAVRRWERPESPRMAAVLEFAREQDEQSVESSLVLRPSWIARGAPDERGPLVRSAVAGVATDRLFENGRFVFDCMAGGCALPADGDGHWLLYGSQAGTREQPTLMMWNQIKQTDGRPVVVLRKFSFLNAKISQLRQREDRAILGLMRENGSEQLRRRDTAQTPVSWAEASAAEAGDLFRVGDSVTVDVENLEWSATPRQYWHRHLPGLASLPLDYELWACKKEDMAIRFDVMTSLAFHPAGADRLVVGTLGGLLSMQMLPDGRDALAGAELLIGEEKKRLSNIERLVFEQSPSQGWILHVLSKTTPAGSQDAENLQAVLSIARAFDKFDVNLSGAPAFTVLNDSIRMLEPEQVCVLSNDAWNFGRQPVCDPVGVHTDTPFNAGWVCSKQGGLFKLVRRPGPTAP